MGKVIDQSTMNMKGPKILYCSRTHSQIQQVASEMHKTEYRGAKCAYLLHSWLLADRVTSKCLVSFVMPNFISEMLSDSE